MHRFAPTFRFVGPDGDWYEVTHVGDLALDSLGRDLVPPSLAASLFLDAARRSRSDYGLTTWGGPACRLADLQDHTRQVARELARGDTGAYVLRRIETHRPAVEHRTIPPADELPPPPPKEPEPPVEPPPTWFQLTVVDELGEALSDVPVRISAGGSWQSTTDGTGTVRIDDAEVSFGSAQVTSYAALEEQLRERWTEARGGEWFVPDDPATSTIVRWTGRVPSIALESKTPHTVVIQPSLSRVRIVGEAFDTNKTFLRPEALPRIQAVVDLYGSHPGAALLIVGHTDTTGEPWFNDPFSRQRAEAVAAYLSDDVDAWLFWYGEKVPESLRWGAAEDQLMLDTVLLRRGEVPEGDPVEHFQSTRGLQVDGDIGDETRRQLVTEYMAIDGTTLPPDITPIAHGCGESFPLADDGVELQVDAPDDTDDPGDRRVELFFFDPPFGVLPPPPGDTSPPGGVEYLEWLSRSRQTDDFLVTRQLALAVRVTDAKTGEVIEGAQVVLAMAEGLSGSGGTSTDVYGVTTFVDLAAASYSLQVFKDGFQSFLGGHVLGQEDAPTVIPVQLAASTPVNLRLRFADPRGEAVAFPEGVDVTVAFEDGEEIAATTDVAGVAAFVTDRREGRFSVSVDMGAESYVVVARDPATPTRRGDRDAALAAAQDRSRFVRLPATMQVSDSARWVVDPLHFEDDRFVTLPLAAKRSKADGALELLLVPTWQSVQLEFYDRFHMRHASVSGPMQPGQPNVVLAGHLAEDTTEPSPTDVVAEAVWPEVGGAGHVHCLAWFPEGARVLPDSEAMLRIVTPPRTFVVSRDAKGEHDLEEVPTSGPRADLVATPSAERMRFYDLPADWRSRFQWARPYGTPTSAKEPFVELATQATTIDAPLVVSLDDIALVKDNPPLFTVGIAPDEEAGSQIAILDHELRVYRPNTTRPAGIGEPYFTDRRSLQPSSLTDPRVPSSMLLDYPPFTRAVIFDRVHDVFDVRTEPTPFGRVVGARAAWARPAGAASPFFFEDDNFVLAFPYYESPPADTWDDGRGSIAVFRCCGVDAAGAEQFGVLRRSRLAFDFAPTSPPPQGARQVANPPAGDDAIAFASQALLASSSRWNGMDSLLPKMRSILAPESAPKKPPVVSTSTPIILVGDPVVARGRHVVLFQRGAPIDGKHDTVLVRIWDEVRAAMPTKGSADWQLGDLEVTTSFTTAHELGHALGLPDEYPETPSYASLRRAPITDFMRSPGLPYASDFKSMMRGNELPRNRHFWSVVPWLAHSAGMFAETPMSVVRGKHRYTLPVTTQVETPSYFPILRTASKQGLRFGKKGLCDLFMYRTGADAYTAERLRGSSPSEPYEALIAMRLKIALSFDEPYSFAQTRDIASVIETALERMSNAFGAEAQCTFKGQPLRARLLFSPRFIVTSFPEARSASEQTEVDDYLAAFEYYPRGAQTIVIQSCGELLEEKRKRDALPPGDPGIAPLDQSIAALRAKLPAEYTTFVDRIIADEGVHCRVRVTNKGLTRWHDTDAVPFSGQLVVNPKAFTDEMHNARFCRLFGKLLGLKTPGGLPPAFEYRPLLEAFAAESGGDLVIGKVRRPP